MPAPAAIAKVALLFEANNAYARGLRVGIGDYILSHGPWSVHYGKLGPADARPHGSARGMATASSSAEKSAASPTARPTTPRCASPSRASPTPSSRRSTARSTAACGQKTTRRPPLPPTNSCRRRRFARETRHPAPPGFSSANLHPATPPCPTPAHPPPPPRHLSRIPRHPRRLRDWPEYEPPSPPTSAPTATRPLVVLLAHHRRRFARVDHPHRRSCNRVRRRLKCPANGRPHRPEADVRYPTHRPRMCCRTYP